MVSAHSGSSGAFPYLRNAEQWGVEMSTTTWLMSWGLSLLSPVLLPQTTAFPPETLGTELGCW